MGHMSLALLVSAAALTSPGTMANAGAVTDPDAAVVAFLHEVAPQSVHSPIQQAQSSSAEQVKCTQSMLTYWCSSTDFKTGVCCPTTKTCDHTATGAAFCR